MPWYFSSSLALFLLWVGFFFFSKSTRREQILMSLFGLVLAPAAIPLATLDIRGTGATMSSLGIEDFLFLFSLFGIAAVIYQALLGKHIDKKKSKRLVVSSAIHGIALLVIMLGVWITVILGLTAFYHVSIAQATLAGGLLIGLYVIADRKDLLANALISGLLIMLLVFLVEQIFVLRLYPEATPSLFSVASFSTDSLAGTPLEALLWSAIMGFAVGPLYEYVRGITLRSV